MLSFIQYFYNVFKSFQSFIHQIHRNSVPSFLTCCKSHAFLQIYSFKMFSFLYSPNNQSRLCLPLINFSQCLKTFSFLYLSNNQSWLWLPLFKFLHCFKNLSFLYLSNNKSWLCLPLIKFLHCFKTFSFLFSSNNQSWLVVCFNQFISCLIFSLKRFSVKFSNSLISPCLLSLYMYSYSIP